MQIYTARESITPDFPVKMAGYESRKGFNTGVHDTLYTKCVVFEDEIGRGMLMTLDLCMVDNVFVSQIKGHINEKYGFEEDRIIIHTIHTHAGPMTYCFNDRLVYGPDKDTEEYLEFSKVRIMVCVDNAMKYYFKGELEFGIGETYIGSSRRHKDKEGVKIGPDPETEIDRTLTVVRVKDDNEAVRLIMFSCPCHPVVLYPDNTKLSGDYPAAACRELEKRYPEALVIFLQGTGAEINPAILIGGDSYRSTFYSDVLFTGKILANDVNNVLKGKMTKTDSRIKASLKSIDLPLDDYMTDYFLQLTREENVKKALYGRRMLEILDSGLYKQGCPFNISRLDLSDDFRIIGLEGEIISVIGSLIKLEFKKGTTLVLGYTNGSVSYIPTKKILAEGGYEAVCAYTKSGLPGPFTSEAADVLIKESVK